MRVYLQARIPTLRFRLDRQIPTDDGRRLMRKKDDKLHHGLVNITKAFLAGNIPTEPQLPDPDSEVSFRAGCAEMGFSSRAEFNAKRNGQKGMIERGEKILGAILPIPHEKKGSKFFYQREIDAYNAAKKIAG